MATRPAGDAVERAPTERCVTCGLPPDGLTVEQVTVDGGHILIINVPAQSEQTKPCPRPWRNHVDGRIGAGCGSDHAMPRLVADGVSHWSLRALEAMMFRPARILVVLVVAVGSIVAASDAHATNQRPLVSSRPTVHAATTSTTAKTTAAAKTTTAASTATIGSRTAVATTSATVVTSPKATTPTKSSAAAATAAATVAAGPVTFRVQAGAARSRRAANAIAKKVRAIDTSAGFVVTGSVPGLRIVSGCRTAADAATIASGFTKHAVTTLVYKSKHC